MSRYAIYFSPASNSPWWPAGCAWLGRDAETGLEIAQPMLPAIPTALFREMTSTPRRYGFHATLKGPFLLKPGLGEQAVLNAARGFCAGASSLSVGRLEVVFLRDFLALRPSGDEHALSRLAMDCVRYFDDLRQAPMPAELASKNKQPLSDRQRQNLLRWGYPYVDEDFRFHFTLSNSLAGYEDKIRQALHTGACNWFAHAAGAIPMHIDSIAVFIEPAPGTAFRMLRRFEFAAGQ
ncbi:Protein of unknown function [Noviherbaspirillum humi]|uniref:Phosphonate metabolism protein n=1 Tax=Noviherbaspirillum humi TaxID=1688639 RepID=A0A239GZI7_9BURK|nr:DUF1045 domain-containing protein [Noviherbaspirillum humi]SNS73434.1 Protein of unknown function [Noviherbaspirillum humi]